MMNCPSHSTFTPSLTSSLTSISTSSSHSTSTSFRSTDRFRRQHDELAELGGQIFACLVIPALEKDPAPVRRLLARFKGKLEMHASMEDEALYPRLYAHPNAGVREAADRLHAEVGDLYQNVSAYLERWPTAQSISSNAPDFARETFDVLRALGKRMKREDRELYPLVDANE